VELFWLEGIAGSSWALLRVCLYCREVCDPALPAGVCTWRVVCLVCFAGTGSGLGVARCSEKVALVERNLAIWLVLRHAQELGRGESDYVVEHLRGGEAAAARGDAVELCGAVVGWNVAEIWL
jgi:hypothetical protein